MSVCDHCGDQLDTCTTLLCYKCRSMFEGLESLKQAEEIARLGRCNDQLSHTYTEIINSMRDVVERITKERDEARDAARVIWAASSAAFELLGGISPETVADTESKWPWIKSNHTNAKG